MKNLSKVLVIAVVATLTMTGLSYANCKGKCCSMCNKETLKAHCMGKYSSKYPAKCHWSKKHCTKCHSK